MKTLYPVLTCLLIFTSIPQTFAANADTTQIDVIEIKGEKASLPPDFTFRARIVAMEPKLQTDLNWRYGGEGQGGAVFSGALGKALAIGQWTESVSLIALAKDKFPPAYMNRIWFITFTAGERKVRSFEVEFEFSYRGKVVKNIKEAGPNGATVGIAIPYSRLTGGKAPDHPDFLEGLCGLLEYARARADSIEKLPVGQVAIAAKIHGGERCQRLRRRGRLWSPLLQPRHHGSGDSDDATNGRKQPPVRPKIPA